MTQTQTTQDDPVEGVKAEVLAAALPNVPFDGWTDRTLADAVRDAGVDPALSRLAFPRGGVDLAVAFHTANDQAMVDRMATEDLSTLSYSQKVARAIEIRLELVLPHREAVRRAASLFALPVYAADGARAVWQTADAIWVALGDTSDDVNWYTKRATLSGVYSACVLFWLGDDSPGTTETRAFIGRRIDDVMQFEKAKSALQSSPLGKVFDAGPGRILNRVRAPQGEGPGRWRR